MKKFNLKYQIATGVALILVGTLVLLSDYIKEKREVVFSEMNLALSSMDPIVEVELPEEVPTEPVEEVQEVKEETNDNDYTYEEYLGVLDIPKINFYKGFYGKTSNLNNVKFNLYVHQKSTYPDVDKGNLIIAGHSGNYNNSYFRNLYLLELGDRITVHYNNKNYIYEIVKIYNEKKTGTVRVLRDHSKTTLTLITCTKDDNNHQTIYISNLISVE